MASDFSALVDIDLSPDVLACSFDQRGKLIRTNKAFSQLFDSDDNNFSLRETLDQDVFKRLISQLESIHRNGENLLHAELSHQYASVIVDIKWQFFAFKEDDSLLFTAFGLVLHPDESNDLIPELVMDYVVDSCFVVDSDGNFLNANQKFSDLLSLKKEQILAMNMTDIFGKQDSVFCSREVTRQLYRREISQFEAHFPMLNQWWFIVCYPLSGQLHVYAKDISERKRYEVHLRQSQSKLKAILDSTSESNLLLDKDIQLLCFNKAASLMAKKLLGVDLQEGKSFLTMLPKVYRKRFEEKFQVALTGSTIKYEREVKGADDNTYWFRFTLFPVINEDQTLIGIAFNAENIWQRKEAEEKLNMYTLIASHITDSVIMTDARGLTTWVNESFTRKTGYTLEDMYGLKPGEVLQEPDTEPQEQLEMHNAVVEGRSFQVEITNYTKSGKPYNVDIKADPYYRSDGKLLGFIAIQPDITNRKKKEEQRIRESWERFHAIFDNSINAILLANDEGYYVDANPAACQISGYSHEEIKTMRVIDLIDGQSEAMPAPEWENFLTRGKMEGTVAIRTKEGENKILDFRAVADILPGLHLSVLSDMTSQYRAEQKILQQNEHLNRLNEEKNQLFSIIAHDLRFPINNLSGMLELLKDESIDKNIFNKQIGLLSQRIHHSMNLMDNLFQWAQHQLKGIKLEKGEIELYEIAQNKLELFKGATEKKNITIQNKVEVGSLVSADFNMIDLVVRNLVANAVKFCSPGGQITLEAAREKDEMIFSVSDTGIGISKENLPKIFGGEVTTLGTGKEKGSGLGLRICKDFVEQHEGRIWVESELKKGSRFRFSLPLG